MLALYAALLGQSNFPDVPMDVLPVDRGGFQVSFQSYGEGPPIVAIPGGPGFSGQALWSFAYEMQDAAQVILFDQYGTRQMQGRFSLGVTDEKIREHVSLDNTVADLEAIRKKCGLKKWTVFGQSWGVIVALKYATEHPNRVDRLVLTSIPALDESGYEALSANLEMRMTPESRQNLLLQAVAAENPRDAVATQVFGVLPYYFWSRTEADLLASRVPPNGIFDGLVFNTLSESLNQQTFDDIKSKLRYWKGETLIIHGLQDPCGADKGYKLHQLIPQSKLQELNYCGHFTWLEPQHTDTFFASVRRFLKLAPRPHYLEWTSQKEFQLVREKRLADGWPFGYVPLKEVEN